MNADALAKKKCVPCEGKAIEHDYRYVRDYQYISKMWRKFRDDEALKEYERDDIKEAF